MAIVVLHLLDNARDMRRPGRNKAPLDVNNQQSDVIQHGICLLQVKRTIGGKKAQLPRFSVFTAYLPSISLRRSQLEVWSITITTTIVRMMM